MFRKTYPLTLTVLSTALLLMAAGSAAALPPDCDTCTCQSSCSSLCSIGSFTTTCGDTGPCVENCGGGGCTNPNYIYGNGESNTLDGTSCNDVIYGYGGHDTIYGQAGHDAIYGGSGNDTCLGGSGDDYIDCGSGSDYCNGGSGYDVCVNCETVVSCP